MTDPALLFPGKVFISTALEALETKAHMSGGLAARYLQRAAMVGILIGVFYATNYAVIAAFDAVEVGGGTLGTLGRIAGALAFGWALVFIYYTKSELLTSNMMIVSVGAYHRRASWGTALRILGLCFAGNVLGGALVAGLLRFSTLTDGAVGEQMNAAVEHKLAYLETASGMGDLFVRAILCNLMINIAMLLVYNGLIKDDLTRALAMIMSVFVFAFLGLCFAGNMLGGALVAVLLRFSTITDGAVGEQMGAAVEHKLAYLETAAGMGDLFVRAILCNLMINVAMLLVYNGLIKDDLTRALAMIMSVFVFAFLGLEHSVANTVLFGIVGLREGIDVGLAAGNVGIALLGNFVGGGVLIGLYFAYLNDDAAYLRRRARAERPEANQPF